MTGNERPNIGARLGIVAVVDCVVNGPHASVTLPDDRSIHIDDVELMADTTLCHHGDRWLILNRRTAVVSTPFSFSERDVDRLVAHARRTLIESRVNNS